MIYSWNSIIYDLRKKDCKVSSSSMQKKRSQLGGKMLYLKKITKETAICYEKIRY